MMLYIRGFLMRIWLPGHIVQGVADLIRPPGCCESALSALQTVFCNETLMWHFLLARQPSLCLSSDLSLMLITAHLKPYQSQKNSSVQLLYGYQTVVALHDGFAGNILLRRPRMQQLQRRTENREQQYVSNAVVTSCHLGHPRSRSRS